MKLLPDQDPSYESELFKQVIKVLGIKKLRTSCYGTSTTGLTERRNITTKNYLTTFLDTHEQNSDWDLLLNLLLR